MQQAVIVSTARTPIGKAFRGAFQRHRVAESAAPILRAVMERAKVEPPEVEELTFGCGYPEGATGGNVARQTALRAGSTRAARPRTPAAFAPRAWKRSLRPRGA